MFGQFRFCAHMAESVLIKIYIGIVGSFTFKIKQINYIQTRL